MEEYYESERLLNKVKEIYRKGSNDSIQDLKNDKNLPENDGSGYKFLSKMINLIVFILVTFILIIQFIVASLLMTIDYNTRLKQFNK